jgi:hypothetical protein
MPMKQRKDEAEVIVRLDLVDRQAHITVHAWTAMARKMERLYGKSLDGDSQQSRRWRVPLNAISFRSLQRVTGRKPMSEERRQALAARMSGIRAKQAQATAHRGLEQSDLPDATSLLGARA